MRSLDRLSTSNDSSSILLRVIEFFSLQKDNGDCVVLLLAHPGLNLLGRYFPPSKINKLLLGESSTRTRPHALQAEMYAMGLEELDAFDGDEIEAFDIMDLASFLEYVSCRIFGRLSQHLTKQIRNSSHSLFGSNTQVMS